MRHHISKLAFAVVSMILVAVATASQAWLMQPALDHIFMNKREDMLILIPLAVMLTALIKGAATYHQSVSIKNIGQRIVCDMQMDLFSHLIYADLALYSDQASGKLVSRFTNDINLLRNATSNVMTGIAKDLLTLIALLGVMVYQNALLSLIALGIFPVVVNPIFRMARRMRKISGNTQNELGDFTSRLDDTFRGIRIIKAYGQEEYEKSRAKNTIEKLYSLYAKASRTQSASSPLMETVAGLAIAGVIWYGGAQVLSGETTPGAFFSFVAAMIMAYKPAKTIAGLTTNLQEGLAAAERLFSVLNDQAIIKDRQGAQNLKTDKASLEFNNVDFSYTQDAKTLKRVSFNVPSGKKIAIVGPSGGGKSTIFNLIMRFYLPENGKIFINGNDIAEYTIKSLREHIAVVTQDTFLFDDTVRANICYGTNASEDEMIECAKMADADDFIKNLSDGYDTLIGQNGVRLSGGQRQRLAIARAMLKKAPILLLDEATSALDNVSEKQIQSALDKLSEGRTTLIIAHRLSTVINADLIYVIKDGEIVESGTHKELLALNKVYYSMYNEEKKS